MPVKFELFSQVDEDGFVALVCPNEYSGYIGEDWTFEQVLGKFVEQMNNNIMFIAYAGADFADEPLRISNTPSSDAARRETSGLLQVGQEGLWLTDYTQLTMAAQFRDEKPNANHHLELPIPPGLYRVTLRQFALSYKDKLDPAIELILEPTRAEAGNIIRQFDAVPWLR